MRGSNSLLVSGRIGLVVLVVVGFITLDLNSVFVDNRLRSWKIPLTTSTKQLQPTNISHDLLCLGKELDQIKDSAWPTTFYYSTLRRDRSGAAIQDMLMAHAYVFQQHQRALLDRGENSMNHTAIKIYRGACGGRESRHTSMHRRLIEELGMSSELPILDTPCSCINGTTINRDINKNRSVNIQLLPSKLYREKDTRIFTYPWIKHIRTRSRPPPSSSRHNKSTNRLVVHVRRGDVVPCGQDHGVTRRYLPNSHYRKLIELYREGQDQPVWIVSERRSWEPWSDFSGSYQMALDISIQEAWRIMVHCRVLIMSKSSFSFVPAIFSQAKTIVYTKFWHRPLPHWTQVDAKVMNESNVELERIRQTSPRCIPRAGSQ